MLNSESFQDYPSIKEIVEKINKFNNKNKPTKVLKLIDELEDKLEITNLALPITYIFSVIAEYNIELVSERLIQKIRPFINSDDVKLKINSITIIGFYLVENPDDIIKYFRQFINLLADKDRDVRNNVHYFLQKFVKITPDLIGTHINDVLKALSLEDDLENIYSLLNFLDYGIDLNFDQLYKFREISKELISLYFRDKSSKMFSKLIDLITKFFPSFKIIDLEYKKVNEFLKLLDNQFLMKKNNFTEISKKFNIRLRDYIKTFKKSPLKDKKVYFYTKDDKKNLIHFFELEKEKFIKFFERNDKISIQRIKETYSEILDTESDLKVFINTLLKLGHIKGYFSKIRYFYPIGFIKSDIFDKFQKKGIVNVQKNYSYLPQKFVHDIILEMNLDFLLSKSGKIYYSLKKIQEQINSATAKKNSIDLKAYKQRLKEEDFIKLMKNIPKEYITNYRKGTVWLTNIGKIKIQNEIENSKIIGYFDLKKISEKLNVIKILIMDVLGNFIDLRSGQWDKTKEIFYYSKYLRKRIDEINLISEEDEKTTQIDDLTRELNIDRKYILTKIDENYKSIGEEIKTQDQIEINEYLEKTGMDHNVFINFINDLELNYFKKGDLLIINPKRIEEAKNSIKSDLIEKSKTKNFISLGHFDISSNLIEELKANGKLNGIFYEIDGEILFYTEKGIRNLMLENSLLFSFHDLFYGKELTQNEIELLMEIFNKLVKQGKLKGSFEEKTLTFLSEEVIFAKDYNIVVDDFGKTVNKYINRFVVEFQKIRKILTKRDEIIYPQEIKIIQEILDKINVYYVKGRAHLEAFIHSANKKLLKEQGYTLKRYQSLTDKNKKGEIKIFRDDPDVNDHYANFNNWVRLFNKIELNYGKIIFLQKKLIKNPDDAESIKKFEELLVPLKLDI